MKGYAGKILRVNLSDKSVKKEDLTEELAKEYIGGRGFAAKILYDELKPKAFSLGRSNKLVMASGPLSGTKAIASGKTTFAARSPLTKGYGDSNIGGHLASELKYAGYDAVIVEGSSDKPCYLHMEDDKVELRDASDYWGMKSMDAEKRMKEDIGEDFQIAVIGPGGESLVKYACISHDYGRQAGRTGLGAVMGSKLLKAIAVKGDKSIEVHDKSALTEKVKIILKEMQKDPVLRDWQLHGTNIVPKWSSSIINAFPTKNFSSGYFEHDNNFRKEFVRKTLNCKEKACDNCPMACGKWSHSKKHGIFVEGPEYETLAMLGSNCFLSNPEDVAMANYLCDQYGIDTISTGNVIAFAMELFEEGIITRKDTGSIGLKFGDAEAVFEMIKQIVHGRAGSLGSILSSGVEYASALFGGTSKYAMHVKGMEISGYESRRRLANFLAYCTCDVGGHHNRAWAITYDVAEGKHKEQKVIELQHIRPMFDMLGACRLPWVELGGTPSLEDYAEMFRDVTGFDHSLDDLLKVSERVWNLTRSFWIKHVPGFGRRYDQPPERWFEEEASDVRPDSKIVTPRRFQLALTKYYKLRGWDKNGIPTPKKLKELGLEFVLDDY